MAYLNPDGDYVELSRSEVTEYKPRFWVDGKPECGVFTWDELQAAFGDMNEIRGAVWSGRIAVDVSARCECRKVALHGR